MCSTFTVWKNDNSIIFKQVPSLVSFHWLSERLSLSLLCPWLGKAYDEQNRFMLSQTAKPKAEAAIQADSPNTSEQSLLYSPFSPSGRPIRITADTRSSNLCSCVQLWSSQGLPLLQPSRQRSQPPKRDAVLFLLLVSTVYCLSRIHNRGVQYFSTTGVTQREPNFFLEIADLLISFRELLEGIDVHVSMGAARVSPHWWPMLGWGVLLFHFRPPTPSPPLLRHTTIVLEARPAKNRLPHSCRSSHPHPPQQLRPVTALPPVFRVSSHQSRQQERNLSNTSTGTRRKSWCPSLLVLATSTRILNLHPLIHRRRFPLPVFHPIGCQPALCLCLFS